MLKKISAGLALATIMSVQAHAADVIDVPEPIIEPVVSAFSWTGAYAGVHVGYTAVETETFGGAAGGVVAAPLANGEIDPDGFMFGVHGGYNYQFANGFLVGVEAELNGLNADGAADCPNPAFSCSVEIGFQANATARLGYALNRFMVYGEIGASYIDADFAADSGNAAALETGTDSDTGLLVGVGAEFAATERLLVKAEYNFADHELFFENSLPGGARVTDYAVDAEVHTVKLGLTFKF